MAVGGSVEFVDSATVTETVSASGVDEAQAVAIVEDYESAQSLALKVGLFAAALIALASLLFTRKLLSQRPVPGVGPAGAPEVVT